jgi:hypothetical protein
VEVDSAAKIDRAFSGRQARRNAPPQGGDLRLRFFSQALVYAGSGGYHVDGETDAGIGATAVAEDDKGSDSREMLRVSGQFLGHGLTWALSVLLFLAVGAWLDTKLGTSPFLLILGAFVGGGAGFYSLYYHIVIEPRNRGDGPR